MGDICHHHIHIFVFSCCFSDLFNSIDFNKIRVDAIEFAIPNSEVDCWYTEGVFFVFQKLWISDFFRNPFF